MICPVLLEERTLRSRFQGWVVAAMAMSATLSLCWLCRGYLITRVPSLSVAGTFFPLFFVAAAGNTFFGFLTHPAIRCLGAMSFSLYLLHGIVFRLVFRILKMAGLTDLPQLDYWLIIIVTAIATTFLCAATYRWIEFPFLSTSHKKPA
jgi:peptidoglycan/LPS O-acetylase OafA/YrhL